MVSISTGTSMRSAGRENEAGLLPRAGRHIFEGLCATEGPSEFAVSCSYLEIYKEVRAPTTVGTTRGVSTLRAPSSASARPVSGGA